MQAKIADLLNATNIIDHGFADFAQRPGEWPCGGTDATLASLPTAVSIVHPLSRAIVDEIADAPTESYFHHYRTVNTAIDQILLALGSLLQNNGFRYVPIPASQSLPQNALPYSARFSHREAAVATGLGAIGRNNMFIHRHAGCAVRLGTLFTDWRPSAEHLAAFPPRLSEFCANCRVCIDACPAGALIGTDPATPGRDNLLKPDLCSAHMKTAYPHIGRGAVCGLCMRHCPQRHAPING